MNDKISDKDRKDWKKFLSNKEKLPNKDQNFSRTKKEKVRSLDLHGYTLEEANKNIEIFIDKSFYDGVNKLIIVTGKGLHSKNEKDPFVSKDFGILSTGLFAGMKFDLIPEDPIFEYKLGNWGPMS